MAVIAAPTAADAATPRGKTMVMRMRKARRFLDVFFLEALSSWNLERVVRAGTRF
jgi:hypothetical protein